MHTKVIEAHSIDEAAKVIVKKLREEDPADTTKHNAIYFDGWDGLGASAVLRAVGRCLTAGASSSQQKESGGLEFSHIFHIDCSKWESRRAMQRVIIEQLKLPPSVMDILDARDEEDDYQGVAKGSRAEMPQVTEVIYMKLVMNPRFLVIFHNGSNEEVDLNSFGFPLSAYLNKVLWSFQGRFRIYPKMKVDAVLKNARMTDVFLSAGSSTDVSEDELSDILLHEAEEVAREEIDSNIGGIDWSAMAVNYFLYMMKLYGIGNHICDYDMSTHGCNYWKCDNGMTFLQQLGDIDTDDDGADRLWLYADGLHREMQLDEDYYQYLSSPVERSLYKSMAYWTSPTYGFMLIPDPHRQILKGMFQQYDKLCVLKLSECMFSFTSPPFLCCNSLRFLCLDHCRDGSNPAEEVKVEDIRLFFQRLWVLDVRYPNKAFLSNYMLESMTQVKELSVVGEKYTMDMGLLHRKMHKIRRLRIKHCYDNVWGRFSFSRIDKMELFEFSSNEIDSLVMEGNCSLETIIIGGYNYLYDVSIKGCTKVKNIFLSGSFPWLNAINITGSSVETLDLSAVTAPYLNKLLLSECEELCAILWPAEDKRKRYLDNLHIDTTREEGRVVVAGQRVFNWHISIRDARILQSLEPIKDYFGPNEACVDVSSPAHLYGDTTVSKGNQISSREQLKGSAVYADVVLTSNVSDEGERSDAPVTTWMCPPPSPSDVPPEGCYLHIEDHLRQTKSQSASSIITLPGFICDGARILHVHDSLHVISILADPTASAMWNKLEWCCVEGCPKLECVLSPQVGSNTPEQGEINTNIFKKLRIAWVSDLPSARYIWNRTDSLTTIYRGETFADLTLLHVDCCPNLIQIMNLPTVSVSWNSLERLEILWCGDLSVVFHSCAPYSFTGWTFLKLKHICLHELPKLQNICNIGLMSFMDKLEIIKIRGCWSLRTLPIVGSVNVVECNCEKEWWDRLEWESVEHRRRYKPIHPRYYKKTMLRGSVLR